MGGRTNKPYARPSKANPDAAGSWKHDLHQAPSLADRLSGSSRGSNPNSGPSSRPSLLSRISGGQGKELIPQKGGKGKELFGFGATPPVNQSNANAGIELLGPKSNANANLNSTRNSGVVRTPRGFQAQEGHRSLAQSGFNAALGQAFGREKREQRRVEERREVSILGAGKQTLVVRVANLAQGTTAEDVVSAFAPMQFLNATASSASSSSDLVSVDLELSSLKDANELIDKYNGQIADGNKLAVSIIKQVQAQSQSQSLSSRMGTAPQQQSRELIVPSSGKMYSDTILQSDPQTRIQTVAEQREEEQRNRNRADVWQKTGGGFERGGARSGNGEGGGGARNGGGGGGGGSLASRLSGGGGVARGRGGGGMMID